MATWKLRDSLLRTKGVGKKLESRKLQVGRIGKNRNAVCWQSVPIFDFPVAIYPLRVGAA